MIYQETTFKGDSLHHINCTGDVCVGDHVAFDKATFTGSFRNPKFAGFTRVIGKVIRDSYGRDKQQHTFTLQLDDGSQMRIKGRNLYANGVWRKAWDDESLRSVALTEKHARGDKARAARARRVWGNYDGIYEEAHRALSISCVDDKTIQ